ncbi:MAG: hypothetical protein ACMG6H_14575, partial [Acidobacteriota bacterium]
MTIYGSIDDAQNVVDEGCGASSSDDDDAREGDGGSTSSEDDEECLRKIICCHKYTAYPYEFVMGPFGDCCVFGGGGLPGDYGCNPEGGYSLTICGDETGDDSGWSITAVFGTHSNSTFTTSSWFEYKLTGLDAKTAIETLCEGEGLDCIEVPFYRTCFAAPVRTDCYPSTECTGICEEGTLTLCFEPFHCVWHVGISTRSGAGSGGCWGRVAITFPAECDCDWRFATDPEPTPEWVCIDVFCDDHPDEIRQICYRPQECTYDCCVCAEEASALGADLLGFEECVFVYDLGVGDNTIHLYWDRLNGNYQLNEDVVTSSCHAFGAINLGTLGSTTDRGLHISTMSGPFWTNFDGGTDNIREEDYIYRIEADFDCTGTPGVETTLTFYFQRYRVNPPGEVYTQVYDNVLFTLSYERTTDYDFASCAI